MVLANEIQGLRAFAVHLLGARHFAGLISFFPSAYMRGVVYLRFRGVHMLRLIDAQKLAQDPHVESGGAAGVTPSSLTLKRLSFPPRAVIRKNCLLLGKAGPFG